MELLTCFFETFVNWLGNWLAGALGLLGIFLPILIYYTQTAFTKRISWCRTTQGGRSWIVLFNGSKRILTDKDLIKSKPLTIVLQDTKSCDTHSWSSDCNSIEGLKLFNSGDKTHIDFTHMEPGAFLVVEMESGSAKNKPYFEGYLENGDIRKKTWIGMTITHHWVFYVIAFVILSASAFAFQYTFNRIIGNRDLSCFTFVISIVFSIVVLGYADEFRRIPYVAFRDASKIVLWRRIDKVYRPHFNNCFLANLPDRKTTEETTEDAPGGQTAEETIKDAPGGQTAEETTEDAPGGQTAGSATEDASQEPTTK